MTTQRIDVTVDGRRVNTNQRADNPAVWTRIQRAAQTAERVEITRHVTRPVPHPVPPQTMGTHADAGVFAGRGIMLGGNLDVWSQARDLADHGYVDVVALPAHLHAETFPCRVVTWVPPEREPHAGDIHQAEKQSEWDTATTSEHQVKAMVVNSWVYGRFDGKVALVELYANEGWALNFEEFHNYRSQGAAAVIPVCGGYPAGGRTNAQAAAVYASLDHWTSEFPGKWMYAGEDPLTDECVDVLRTWKP